MTSRPLRFPRPCVVGALLVLALLTTAVPADAHAVVVETSPADRATLDSAPSQVVITFDEPVAAVFDGVRVFDADANRVDTGPVDTGEEDEVVAGLPEDLPDGGYVVVYRVASTDSHPIGGVTSFTIGDADAVGNEVVARLFRGGAGALGEVLGGLLRALGYAATLLAAGSVAFARFVASRPQDRMRARRWARAAAVVAVVVTFLSLPAQGIVVSGSGIGAAADLGVLSGVLSSSFGVGALVRVAALVGLLLLWRENGRWMGPLLAAVVAAGSFALDGHQRSVEPIWLLAGGDLVHLLAAAVWFAGLVLLTQIVRRGAEDDPVAGAELVRRFSALASLVLVALTIAGAAMVWPLVRSFSALTSTGYGWTLVAKLVLVAVVLGVAAYNRQRLVPAVMLARVPVGGSTDTGERTELRAALQQGAWRRLRVTLLVEMVVVLGVLGVTAALVTQRPAAEAAGLTGLYETQAPLGDELQVELLVDPNRAGLNSIHVYVLDETGRPSREIDDLRLELTYLPERIGPIPIEPYVAGPGHWVASGNHLAFPGEWEVRVIAGIGRFDEDATTVVVPVA